MIEGWNYCFMNQRMTMRIVSRFLIETRKDPEKMTDKYLRDIILNFLLVGKDSSANTFSWFLYMMFENPLIQARVVQEIREKVARLRLQQFNETELGLGQAG
ncbi:Cytochrome P450 [Dillenia turbinata]|uniref:Cytochrome P450 n=1 Tax=Dillenia turbinata TaxID=194707 RepID=A0AAN8UR76_9MAGN